MPTKTPKQVLAEVLGVSETDLADDKQIAEFGDSLDLVECVIMLEDEFAIIIPDEETPGNITVGALVAKVNMLVESET